MMQSRILGPAPTLALMLFLLCTPGLMAQASDDRHDNDLPLAGWSENRNVPIDLTEGSWISLDVSPDGQTIVFDFLGDLFTVPIGGGDATQITSGMGFDAQPRFSPDGRSIAFQSDMDGGENLYVMSTDSSHPSGPPTARTSSCRRGDSGAGYPSWPSITAMAAAAPC